MELLLKRFAKEEGNRAIDVNQIGGQWRNTAFHLAGMRSRFDIMYLLQSYGADIFVRSREGKTCFHYVNNNLLMLKIVKKLERRQYLREFLDFCQVIAPSEAQFIYCYAVKLNTGDYKAVDWIIQRIKREFFRPTAKDQSRPSIFAKRESGRASRQNSKARARENSVSGHIKSTTETDNNEAKYERVSYLDFLTEDELVVVRPWKMPAQPKKDIQQDRMSANDSPKSSSFNFGLVSSKDHF